MIELEPKNFEPCIRGYDPLYEAFRRGEDDVLFDVCAYIERSGVLMCLEIIEFVVERRPQVRDRFPLLCERACYSRRNRFIRLLP